MQTKLTAAALHPREAVRRRTDNEAASSLLDHGYVRCAECRGALVRYWASRSPHPFYQCAKNAAIPSHPHKAFYVPAHRVDALALRLLAKALSDPEQVLRLANAAEEQFAEAQIHATLAESARTAAQTRLSEINAQTEELSTTLGSLGRVPGMENHLADIRLRLSALARDRHEAEAEMAQASPHQSYTAERAAFLRQLFQRRNWLLDFSAEATITEVPLKPGEPAVEIGVSMPLAHAASLLGNSEEALRATGIAVEGYWLAESADTDSAARSWEKVVQTEQVLYLLLRRAPREQIRKLLADLQVVVLVRRGRSCADYLARGPIPLAERVSLEVLDTVEVRTAEQNVKEVFVASERAIGGKRLGYVADDPADQRLLSHDIVASNRGGSRCRRQEGGQHLNRGRLARAVWPQQAKDLTRSNLQIEAVNCFHLAKDTSQI